MKRIFKYPAIFAASGVAYGGLELAFRGRTHWSMLIAGGVCGAMLYTIAVKSRDRGWKKCLMGGAVITAVEFVAGAIVNVRLGWDVWSYSHLKWNLLGQICPLFSAMWTLLSIPVIGLFSYVERRVFGVKRRS